MSGPTVSPSGQPVAVVTGGGGGIGAAIAEELGRTGHIVVTVDPLVTLDGAERLASDEPTTAERIVAAGGTARASALSVTDAEGVRALFDELVAEHGRLDAVVNVAGITRPTTFATGSPEDWLAVLSVHLDGYRNVLAAALPIMARAGHGRILGVTSGSGWRPADTGAYGCAKRAVASLTWQLGRQVPAGVSVNAVSPIAATRMVTAALARVQAQRGGGSGASATGGLSLGSMPGPERLGPIGAHLAGEDFAWSSGRIVFASGAEVAVVEPPRLLEVVRTDGVDDLAGVLDVVGPGALVPAEAAQATNGATNPRFPAVFSEPGAGAPATLGTVALVSDRPDLAAALGSVVEARGGRVAEVPVHQVTPGFAGAAEALAAVGPVDGVVVALSGAAAAGGGDGWERVLAEHDGIVGQIRSDAAWTRAVADAGPPTRLVTVTDASTAGGRSRAQASAQLTRPARKATAERVAAFAVSLESASPVAHRPAAELVGHLLASPEAVDLSGAELVVTDGWLGLRSHPRAGGSITYGGPDVPTWLDGALHDLAAEAPR